MSTTYVHYPIPSAGSVAPGAFPLQGPNGSVTAPSFSFSSSTTTGVYSPAANQIAITTNGTQALLFDASQVAYFNNDFILNGNASAFPASTTYDTYACILRTNGAGTAPFNNAGSMIYRPRVTATSGRSSHLFYTGSGPTLGFKIDEQQQVTIGAGTAGVHTLNTQLATNGSGVGTLTNLPSGVSGNPAGYIQMTINGSTHYIPFF